MGKNVHTTFTLNSSTTTYKGSVSPPSVVYYTLVSPIDLVVAGGKLPRYKRAIESGANATTQLSVNATFPEINPASATLLYKQRKTAQNPFPDTKIYGNICSGLLVAPQYAAPIYNSNAEARAIRQLYSKIQNLTQSFQGGVFVGELHQTVKMMMHPCSSIAKFSKRYVDAQKQKIASGRRRGLKPRDLAKSITDDYLQWVYGVVPLMNDIKDLSGTLARIANDPPIERFTARGSGLGDSHAWGGGFSEGECKFTKEVITTYRTEVKYYGAFRGMQRDPGVLAQISRVGTLSGFNLRAFVPTIWNLIPYSFVADYFVNIGDMLEALCTDTSAVIWISRTQLVETRVDLHIQYDPIASTPDKAAYEVLSNSGASGVTSGYTRTIARAALPSVPLLLPHSNLGNNFGLHMRNLAALFANKFAR